MLQKLLKGRTYSRAETIHGNTVLILTLQNMRLLHQIDNKRDK
jgi:hypothetical protein